MHLVQNCRMEVQTEWWVDHSFIFIFEVDFLYHHFIYFWFTDRNDNKRRSGYWIGRILSHWGQSANCRSLDCFWPGWVKEKITISSIYLKKNSGTSSSSSHLDATWEAFCPSSRDLDSELGSHLSYFWSQCLWCSSLFTKFSFFSSFRRWPSGQWVGTFLPSLGQLFNRCFIHE